MIDKLSTLSSAALVATCLFTLAACKGGDGSGDTGTDSATDGTGTDSTPTGGDPGGDPAGDPGGDPGGDPSSPTEDPTGETADPTGEPEDGPHALGTIFLGESHPSAGGTTVPAVSAFFVPDVGTGAGKACTENVAGCELNLLPECDGCAPDEYCGFNDACEATCQPLCDAQCGADEVCYFPSPNTPGCKKIEAFDAGSLTFLGTQIPITLFPPYSFMSDDNASPYVPGGAASVKASGASNAGFAAFDKEFTGTDFIQTSPKLDTLGITEVFGDGPLPIKWTPGTGEVTITATVTGADFVTGTVTCKADDSKGSFDVPREALKAAVGGGDVSGLSVSIQRQRIDLYKDLTTKGSLTGATVQPVGFLQIITSSTEYHAFQGCNPGELVCDEACVDVQFDDDNCGGCGETCAADSPCNSGSCAGETACNACAMAAETGACKAEQDACKNNPACADFEECWFACNTQAACDMCLMGVPQEILDLYDAQVFCVCDDACQGECVTLCN